MTLFRLTKFVIILLISVGNAVAANGRRVEFSKLNLAATAKFKHDQNDVISVPSVDLTSEMYVKRSTAAHPKRRTPPIQLPPTSSPFSQPTSYPSGLTEELESTPSDVNGSSNSNNSSNSSNNSSSSSVDNGAVDMSSDMSNVEDSGLSNSSINGSASVEPSPTAATLLLPTLYVSKLFAEDGVTFEHFGHKVLADSINNLVAVSTLLDGTSGRVLLYKPTSMLNSTGYELLMAVSSPAERKIDGFGSAMSLYNNTLLIGAPYSNTVYVYAPDGSTGEFRIQQTIKPKDVTFISKFGCSISVHGDYAIIGASGDSTLGFRTGAAYIYYKGPDGWDLASKLLPRRSSHHEFGRMVSISSTTAAVTELSPGSHLMDGAVHIYHLTSATVPADPPKLPVSSEKEASPMIIEDIKPLNLVSDVDIMKSPEPSLMLEKVWKLESILVSPESPLQTSFGHTIHVTGDFCFVSSYAEDGSGQVGVYERFLLSGLEDSVSWKNTVQLSASSKSYPGNQFGYSITSRDSDTLLLIGAPENIMDDNQNSGKVYLFAPIKSRKVDLFNEERRLTAASNGNTKKLTENGILNDNNFPTTGSSYFDAWGLVATLSLDMELPKAKNGSLMIPTKPINSLLNLTDELRADESRKRNLEDIGEYYSAFYEVTTDSKSLSYGSSVAFIGDVMLIGAELGDGISNYTGVVHIDNDIERYLSNHLDISGASGDKMNKTEKIKDFLNTSKVGITMLVAIPVISLAVFFLFCANYNKVLCENDASNMIYAEQFRDEKVNSSEDKKGDKDINSVINFHLENDNDTGTSNSEDVKRSFMDTLPSELSNFLRRGTYKRGSQEEDFEGINLVNKPETNV